jgi:hypothetical protein
MDTVLQWVMVGNLKAGFGMFHMGLLVGMITLYREYGMEISCGQWDNILAKKTYQLTAMQYLL